MCLVNGQTKVQRDMSGESYISGAKDSYDRGIFLVRRIYLFMGLQGKNR